MLSFEHRDRNRLTRLPAAYRHHFDDAPYHGQATCVPSGDTASETIFNPFGKRRVLQVPSLACSIRIASPSVRPPREAVEDRLTVRGELIRADLARQSSQQFGVAGIDGQSIEPNRDRPRHPTRSAPSGCREPLRPRRSGWTYPGGQRQRALLAGLIDRTTSTPVRVSAET